MARAKKRTPTTAEFEAVLKLFRDWGREGGKKGGPARAAKLTPEQRKASASKAARAHVVLSRADAEAFEQWCSTTAASLRDRQPPDIRALTLETVAREVSASLAE